MEQGQIKVFVIWALFIGLLVVSCTLIAVEVSRGYGQTCELLAKAPRSDIMHLKNISDANLTALANLAAYLKYEPNHLPSHRDNKFSYLNLTLELIDYKSPWMYFVAQCAKMSFLLTYEPEIKSYEAQFIYISTCKEPLDNQCADLCYIEPRNIVFQESLRYACHRTMQYPCIKTYEQRDGSKDSQIVAWFVVDNLEIELGGSADAYRRGEFSKEAQLCRWGGIR